MPMFVFIISFLKYILFSNKGLLTLLLDATYPTVIIFMSNEKHCHAINLKFRDKLLTYLTKLMLKAKASICSKKIYFYIVVRF